MYSRGKCYSLSRCRQQKQQVTCAHGVSLDSQSQRIQHTVNFALLIEINTRVTEESGMCVCGVTAAKLM